MFFKKKLKKVADDEEACGGGLGTSNMNRYELTSIERLLDTHNSSWVKGKGQEKAPS
jgi:hypothetical protein